MSPWLLALALLALGAALLVARAVGLQASAFDQQARVLLVVAHPDDETMFFSPMLLSLTLFGVPVHVLCLSNGGAYGLGKVRQKELVAACQELKVPPRQVTLIDHAQLQDGQQDWPQEVVAQQVKAAAEAFQATKVVTFDGYGVSGHVNHRHTHRGVLHLMRTTKGSAQPAGAPAAQDAGTSTGGSKAGNASSLQGTEYYCLESVNLARKYSGLLDLPLSSLLVRATHHSHLVVNPAPHLCLQAMWKHRSQLVWYRVAFVLLSRYTFLNTLRRME